MRSDNVKESNKLQLKNKAALVTGATAGIALAIAQQLARGGAGVTITGRAQDKLQRALETIGNAPKAFWLISVTQPAPNHFSRGSLADS